MCYTVKNNIVEEPGVKYEDGVVSLFLYTKGTDADNKELSQLLHYIENSTEANATTEELKELHQYVSAIKKKKEVGVRYMKSWELERMWKAEARREGLAEGRQEGCREGVHKGKMECIIDLLGCMGDVSDSLIQQLEEADTESLGKWLQLAARAKSIGEFEEKVFCRQKDGVC